MSRRAEGRGQRAERGALAGILIADFSRILAGPLCTQILSDAGARVIKIEEARLGDETRRWGPPFAGDVSAYFLSVNRNKESLALDLRSEEGRAIAAKLIARADVVIDNFLPAQRATLGLDRVMKLNPRAIHCSITGFDSDLADAERPGFDLLAQAGAGLMSITGRSDGEPSKVGVALSDVLTAHYAASAIGAALYGREKNGKGQRIEVSLFASTLASLVNVAQNALVTGKEAGRFGNAHPSIVPYQLFHASDRAFVVGAGTDRHFKHLCSKVIGRMELAEDPRFSTNAARVKNRSALITILEEIFRSRKASQWVARCRRAGVPAEIVRGVREALRTAGGRAVTVKAGDYETVASPVRIDGKRPGVKSPPPVLGEQSESILRELGYTRREIAAFAAAGVIGTKR
ncbi:MAG: CoA transferase [Thermoanaerobaculia bacterium]|nr:CoA transferase [Thermoanaerobaculia bacterium]